MDLSYSGIVNKIQGSEPEGANLLFDIAHKKDIVELKIEKLEKDLASLKIKNRLLIQGSQYVMEHLKKEVPFAVVRLNLIVVVTKENISIERNVVSFPMDNFNK